MTANIKLIKWGLIFFSEPATITFDKTQIQIVKQDGSIALACAPGALAKANYNSINGMLTLKASTGQKCNIAFREGELAKQFGEFLDDFGVKGFTI
jgi:hypothetical protein